MSPLIIMYWEPGLDSHHSWRHPGGLEEKRGPLWGVVTLSNSPRPVEIPPFALSVSYSPSDNRGRIQPWFQSPAVKGTQILGER